MKTKHMVGVILVLVFASGAFLIGRWLAAPGEVPNYAEARNQFTQKLKSSKKAGTFTKAEYKLMDDAAAALKRRFKNPGLKVGSLAPDFTLPNALGKPVSLSSYLKQGPVVLVFYRGAWCPFCNLHLRTLHQSLPHFRKYGANLITITPQTPDKSLAQVKKAGYPFEVLSDLDSKVMKAYNLYFQVDPTVVALYKRKGLNLEAFNGPGRNVLPVPGTFVIDQTGTIVAMEADTDYQQRMEPAAIVKALKKIEQPK